MLAGRMVLGQQRVDRRKRRFLIRITCLVEGAAAAGAAVPFVASLAPSARARVAGAPVEADIGNLAPGEMKVIEWRGKPVWVLRRTRDMLAAIHRSDALVSDPRSEVPQQPGYAENEFRSIDPEIVVLVGVCTHLGCSPQFKPAGDKEMGPGWNGGFYCPCHGSKFDLAGRVFEGSPAPTNLLVPPYTLVNADRALSAITSGVASRMLRLLVVRQQDPLGGH
jgi:ubiquinol-cytochrome c reductase iron-sulfur subunit